MKYSAAPSIILLIGLPVLFSSFTLFLVDNWIKYPLFIIESVAIITIYWVLSNQEIGNSFGIVNRLLPGEKSAGLILDLILVASASILIILNGFHTTVGGLSHIVLAFICTSFLSGHALLDLFKVTRYFSKLEILLFSFLGSFIFSAFVSLLLLPVDENIRIIIMPSCYLALGILSILRRLKSKPLNEGQPGTIERPRSFSKNIDILAIVLCVAFYILFFMFVYPNAALLPGSDISRHFNYSSILSRSPDLYGGGAVYLLFHAFEAAVLVMSGIQQSVAQVQTVLVVLNVFLPISIYLLAKRFLSDIDKRIPAISVLFYAILSNFSFIYYTQLKIVGTAGAQIVNQVAERSQNGNINPLQPFPFFVPLSVSLILFVIAFLLLREIKIPRVKFVLLFSTIILSMYLTHVAEAVVFTIFLGLYSFISRSKSLRIDDALISSLIGLVIAAIFVGSTYLWTADRSYTPSLLNILSLFFPSLLVSSSLIWRRMILSKIKVLQSNKFLSRPIFYQSLSVIFTLIYLFGFLTWFLIEDLKTSTLYELGTVPWFIYPVMLGIAGLLAVLSISYIRNIMPNSPVILLLSAIGFMLLFGRLISFVSLNIIILDYWEKRILGLMFIPICLLAPISLIGIKDRIQTIRKDKTNSLSLRNFSVLMLICIIIFSGFSSVAVQSEYWFTRSSMAKISEKELEAVNFLKDVFRHDIHAYAIAPSTASREVLAWTAPTFQSPRPELLVSSVYPDLALAALDAQNLTHAYIYLHNRDLDALKKEPVGWLKQHLLPTLPVIFSNNEVTIYNTTSVSFPVSNSDSTLIIPTNAHDKSWLYAYDVVSQSRKNYTVRYDNDPMFLKSKNVILGSDPGSSSSEKFSSGASNRWEIIRGNWNFSSKGLVVEDNSDSLQNVILSQSRYAAKNLSIGTSFKSIKIDPRTTSYVSVVYSWLDPKNYESAGVTLSSEGISMNFAKVTNGKLSFQPSWPGIKTNLSWKPNVTFNITLQFNEESKSITLAGMDSALGNIVVTLQIPHEGNKQGYLGLSYGRGGNIIFDNFEINDTRRYPLDNYIRYVKEGGNLMVFNTNGYGEFASSFFNGTLLSQLGDSNNMPVLLKNTDKGDPKNVGFDVNLGGYGWSKNGFKPASLKQEINIGQGKITYINIYPFLKRFFENRSPGNEAYYALGEISKIINLTTTSPSFNFDEISVIFRNFTATGKNIEVDTKSVIFPNDKHLSSLKIRTGQKSVELTNVTHLSISDYDHVLLNSNAPNSKIAMNRGTGLYTGLILSNGIDQQLIHSSTSVPQLFSVSLVNNGTLSVTSNSSPQKTHLFGNVSSIHFTSNNPLEVVVRQPTIRITDGKIMLNNLYAESDDLYRKIGASLADLKVLGNMSISIVMADTYALAKLDTSDARVKRVPSLPQYNELESFLPNLTLARIYSIPPLILLFSLLPFLIGIIFLIYSPRKILEST